jgi:hypothetical protein
MDVEIWIAFGIVAAATIGGLRGVIRLDRLSLFQIAGRANLI